MRHLSGFTPQARGLRRRRNATERTQTSRGNKAAIWHCLVAVRPHQGDANIRTGRPVKRRCSFGTASTLKVLVLYSAAIWGSESSADSKILLKFYRPQTAVAGMPFQGEPPQFVNPKKAVRFQLVDGPPGLTIHQKSGMLRWERPAVGQFDIVVRVTTSDGADLDEWKLRVVRNDFLDPVIVSMEYVDFVVPRENALWIRGWRAQRYLDAVWEYMYSVMGQHPRNTRQIVRFNPKLRGGAHSGNPIESGRGFFKTDPVSGWSLGAYCHELAHNFNGPTNVHGVTKENWAQPYYHHMCARVLPSAR
jgi:hypothetical protein